MKIKNNPLELKITIECEYPSEYLRVSGMLAKIYGYAEKVETYQDSTVLVRDNTLPGLKISITESPS